MQSRSRILVIEDDPIFRNLVFTLLRKDFLVSVAPDGETGFRKAREHRPDLVIIDFQMPGWNGLKTLQVFRADRSLAGVKVMMLTSDASKETVLAAIQAGTDDYTIKTAFNKSDFLAKINKLLAPMVVKAVNPAESVVVPFSSHQAPLFGSPTGTAENSAVSGNHSTTSEAFPESGDTAVVDSDPAISSNTTSTFSEQPEDPAENQRLQEIMDDWE